MRIQLSDPRENKEAKRHRGHSLEAEAKKK